MTSEFAMVIAYGRSSGMGRRCGWHENMTGYMALRLPRPNIYPHMKMPKACALLRRPSNCCEKHADPARCSAASEAHALLERLRDHRGVDVLARMALAEVVEHRHVGVAQQLGEGGGGGGGDGAAGRAAGAGISSRLDTTERPISVAAEAPSVDVTSVVMAAVSSSMPKVMPILAIMPTWIGTSAKASENGMGAAAADAARPAAMFTSISARFLLPAPACCGWTAHWRRRAAAPRGWPGRWRR